MPSFIDIMKFIFGGHSQNNDASRELHELKEKVSKYKERAIYAFIATGLGCILIVILALHACE